MMKSLRSFLRALALVHIVVFAAMQVAAQSDDPSMGSVSIHAVRYHVEPGRTRVWFETSGTILYTQYSPDPLTLVIDLPGVDVSGIAERTVVGSREVESVLVARLEGLNGKSLSRIEIKLGSLVPYQISATQRVLTVVFEGAGATEPQTEIPAEAEAPAARDEPIQSTRLADESSGQAEGQEESAEAETSDEVGEIPAAEPAPEPDYSSYTPAAFVDSVRHSVDDDLLTVTVEADGRLNYTSFRLDNPKRLVFDFANVTNRVRQATMNVEAVGIHRIRIAQYRSASPRITRVVFDLEDDVQHRSVERGDVLEILFAKNEDRLAEAAPTPPVMASANAIIPLAAESTGAGDNEDSYVIGGPDAGLSLDGSDAATLEPVAVVAQDPIIGLPAETGTIPLLPTPPQETPAEPTTQLPPMSFETQTIGPEERVYTGELISLDFKDGDIQDIFRLFADISGLNIVVQPGVAGRVTLKLTEVPWDQALELILKTHKLGYVVEGNVVRIAPLSELADEEAERRRLAEEQALSGDLITLTRQLSYAKADDVQALLQRNLSARGDIEIDERTNTLIITDLGDRLENINSLIVTLDTPIPGVEIEARVVVTNRTFARMLGIQWGFVGHANEVFGNTTVVCSHLWWVREKLSVDTPSTCLLPGPRPERSAYRWVA
jgi:hypothetical protein